MPYTQDLLTYGITINTFFVDRANHRFNPTLYWNVSWPSCVSCYMELANFSSRTYSAERTLMMLQHLKHPSPRDSTNWRIC